jgi:hypothetical protein
MIEYFSLCGGPKRDKNMVEKFAWSLGKTSKNLQNYEAQTA